MVSGLKEDDYVKCKQTIILIAMKKSKQISGIFFIVYLLVSVSCSVIEKSSQHGFGNGYYKFKTTNLLAGKVYVKMDDQKLDVFSESESEKKNPSPILSLSDADTLSVPVEFIKKSLDIDLTTILLKYRPSVKELPAQMITDFNMAIYAGWRHDKYFIKNNGNDVGKGLEHIIRRGYDFGIFAGPGTTSINPFSTMNMVENEYNGMILQYGLAGFLESNVASFGIAAGFDYLLSRDRKIWIYNNQPWFGLIIGIALN